MQVTALVLAAGRGVRLGADVPKAFVSLLGKTLLERSIEVLLRVPSIDRVVPVIPLGGEALWKGLAVSRSGTVADPVPGGATRQASVLEGLEALDRQTEWVAVHDAARCLVSEAEVAAVIAGAQETGAAILARRSADTLKIVLDGAVESTPDRNACWLAQTPQVFRADLLRAAVEGAGDFIGTDDAQLVARLGTSVRVVPGSARNLKITTPDDFRLAEALLQIPSREAQ
jgi:2-C-methyl-D-erythritol 4-phosphate cytidylyltransferase